jgi:DNA-directed RNA polymerase subunit alpha
MRIEALNMSRKTTSALIQNGVETVEDLKNITENDIYKFKNFGRKSLEELLKRMKETGISFKY